MSDCYIAYPRGRRQPIAGAICSQTLFTTRRKPQVKSMGINKDGEMRATPVISGLENLISTTFYRKFQICLQTGHPENLCDCINTETRQNFATFSDLS